MPGDKNRGHWEVQGENKERRSASKLLFFCVRNKKKKASPGIVLHCLSKHKNQSTVQLKAVYLSEKLEASFTSQ